MLDTLAPILAALLGVMTWSFLEYTMHRWLGHDRKWVKRTPFGYEHTHHHSRGDHFAAAWKKGLFMLVCIVVIGGPAWLLAGTSGLAYTGGLVGGYLVYEVLHRLLHVWPGVGPWGRWARRHHFYHHFHDPKTNHGVTSPLWDHVFGTYVRPARIEVPPRLAMRWLVDDTTGQVRARHARDFALR